MKREIPLAAVCGVLLITNAVILVRYQKLKQKVNDKEISISQLSKDNELATYEFNFVANILNNNISIRNTKVKDSIDNTMPICDIFANNQEKLLVCRFSRRHCESCVVSSIQILRSWVDSIGTNNMV
ncbi:MAG: hypothetical protein ACK5HT_06680, partial [Draconibacterium sp.]